MNMNVNPAGQPFNSQHLQFQPKANATGKMQNGKSAKPLARTGETQTACLSSMKATSAQTDAMKARTFKPLSTRNNKADTTASSLMKGLTGL